MSRRMDCALDGIWLQTLDSALYTKDIREEPPRVTISALPAATCEGQRVLTSRRSSLTVTVLAEVRERSPERRCEVLERVAAWAKGRTLTTTLRPDRILRVRCTEWPAAGSGADWASEVRMRFTAYEVPWWQDAEPTTVTLESAAAAASTMLLPGFADSTPVSCAVMNAGTETLSDLNITCGSTHIALTGLSVAAGRAVNITHDLDGVLRVTAGGVSAMANRTSGSDDDLLIPCGLRRPIAVSANTAVTAIFSGRGRYL